LRWQWRRAALGTPQAILSEEDLAYKEATKVGSGALDEFALSSPSRKHSRSASRRLSPGKAAKRTSSSPKSRELSELCRSRRSNDKNLVVPKEQKGMILPFEPLSISFDDISYFVDMPAVSNPPSPCNGICYYCLSIFC
jgi:hypothetical protein